MIEFTLTRTTTASIEAVFDALTDHRAMADQVRAVRRSTLDREGTPAPNGVGAVRRITVVGPPIVEEITAYERPHRLGYRMLSGLPVRDHVGTVELRETTGGTEVSWHLTTTPKLPGAGPLLKPVAKKVIGDLLAGAVTAAERGA